MGVAPGRFSEHDPSQCALRGQLPDAEHDDVSRVAPLSRDANAERRPPASRVASLRGPTPVRVGRRTWQGLGLAGWLILSVAVAVSFVSAANDNARIDRMKSHGIPVTITVVDCAGNLGGSGSNGAGYTCSGDYTVGGVAFHEVIGSMNTFAATGTAVRAVADPAQPSEVVLASAVKESAASWKHFILPSLLALALVALTFVSLRAVRRPVSPPPGRSRRPPLS
jgi:hypothetical protein